MANTNFKVFNEDMSTDRTFSDSEYELATQRQIGVIPGMAISRLHNKLFRQSSAMAKAIADFLVAQGIDCMDNDIPAITAGIQSAIANTATDEIQSHNSDLNAHAGLLHLWQPTHVYAVGDICYSPSGASYKFFECTVAGTSGAAETTWPAVGGTVVDGTVTWAVRDLRVGTAQFDSSTKLATTTFVNNVGMQYQGVAYLSSSRSVIASDVGNLVFVNANGLTYTLPKPGDLIGANYSGKTITVSTSSYPVTIVPGSGSVLYLENGTSVPSIILPAGATIVFHAGSSVQWRAIGGSGALAGSVVFGSLLGSNGYQKLPSGLIIQWGLITLPAIGNYNAQNVSGTNFYTNFYNITYPIAFPTTSFSVEATIACSTYATQGSMFATTASANLSGTGNNLTGMTIAVTSAALGFIPTVHWIVIGK